TRIGVEPTVMMLVMSGHRRRAQSADRILRNATGHRPAPPAPPPAMALARPGAGWPRWQPVNHDLMSRYVFGTALSRPSAKVTIWPTYGSVTCGSFLDGPVIPVGGPCGCALYWPSLSCWWRDSRPRWPSSY